MKRCLFLPAAIGAVLTMPIAAQETPGTRETGTSALGAPSNPQAGTGLETGTPPRHATGDGRGSADEALRAAQEALDRLEEADGETAVRALLDEVSRHLADLRASDPDHPRLPYLFGRIYQVTGRSGDAIDQLRKFVKTREGRNEWRAYRMLGDLFIDEFPRLAKANYEKAAALKAGEPSVLYGLSLSAMKLGRQDEALRLVRQAVESDDEGTVAYVSHLARILLSRQAWDEAERTARSSLELAGRAMRDKPSRSDPIQAVDAQYALLMEIVQSRLAAADPRTAEPTGLEAVETAGLYLRLAGFVRERMRLASILSQHQVLRVLEAGVERTSLDTPVDLLEAYALALADVGRSDDAFDIFQRVLAASPQNARAAEWLQRHRDSLRAPEKSEPTDQDPPP
ncbi:MAG: hypothetical protein IIC01_06360 [Planctomycetes bacterium]|nr:hypothetical protein [Planctomycetota bacterium]